MAIDNRRKGNEKEPEKSLQNKYSLPYGLCAKYGIWLPSDATPTDAWNALKEAGIKPSDVYKDLEENGKVDKIKPTGEKVEESKEATKKKIKDEKIEKITEQEVIDKIVESLTEEEKAGFYKEFIKQKYKNNSYVSLAGFSVHELALTFDDYYGDEDNQDFTDWVNSHWIDTNKLNNTEQKQEDTTNDTFESKTFEEDAYSKDRKDKALWFKGSDGKQKSQEQYTPVLSKVWATATQKQKKDAYNYTEGSGKFNRPLRGYKGHWGYTGYEGVGNVDLNYEGAESSIKGLTNLIEKSSYKEDIWVQRGVSWDAAQRFLGISGNFTHDKVQSLIGKEVKDFGFYSTGASKGTGFAAEPVIFNTYCPAGTKMLYCAPFSYYGGEKMSWDGKKATGGQENEMLLQRQTTFRVTKAEEKHGTWYFDVEVIKQEIDDSVYK